jgi:sugar (pentulose or hexulose) kinase
MVNVDMQTILTIDIGSTNMKAVLHDARGSVIHIAKRRTLPDYLAERQVEMDASTLRGKLISLISESCSTIQTQGRQLIAISVTSQRSSVLPVDADGNPLAPIIMWHDKRTATLCNQLQMHDDRVFALSGMTISPVYSAIKMLWFKRHRPEIYQKTAKMLGIHDFAVFTLCGRFVTDHSLASSTNLLNVHNCQWDQDLIDIFSVDRSHLCDLIPPGSICGKTTPEISHLTGLPTGIPVISAGGDQQCGALGQGVFAPGRIKCTTGTGSYLLAYADTPVIDQQKRFLCKIGAIPGTYCLEAGIFTTGTVYRWFDDQFYREVDDEQGFEVINQEVLQSPPGAKGVLMLPHYEGSGAPHWNPADTGAFYNINLSTSRADMARAILEGIVMETKENILLFEQFIGKADRISVAGGMTKFDFYNQLQADIFSSQVVAYSNPEATALGAWISAAVTCGLFASYDEAFRTAQFTGKERVFSPNTKRSAFYEAICERRKSLYNALKSMHSQKDDG